MMGYTLQWSHVDRYGHEATAMVKAPEECVTFGDMFSLARQTARRLQAPVTIVDDEGEEVITVNEIAQ